MATQLPDRVASVITSGAPFRGVSVHPLILRAVDLVHGQIHDCNGEGVLPAVFNPIVYDLVARQLARERVAC